jgi:hypothetical protein
MKLVPITCIFLLQEISSFPKNVPPPAKKGSPSPAIPNVNFEEVEHERKDSKKQNRLKHEAEVDKDEAEVELDDHCKPCHTVLTAILREYEKSSGWMGHVDFAIKKVTG